jgi:DNA helicase-2/ATP-dependent DNA helicase PcrA
MVELVGVARALELTGDPGKDWLLVKGALRASTQPLIAAVAGHLDYLVAFNRGKRIAARLSAMWTESGCYVDARGALDAALAEDQLLGGPEDLSGIHVMTIHKSKAKQFDGVIILREGQPRGRGQWVSSFLWRGDVPPYHRSRKILRVAITRARKHVLILEPPYPPCRLLSPGPV